MERLDPLFANMLNMGNQQMLDFIAAAVMMHPALLVWVFQFNQAGWAVP
jgi:hypothetical protein